MPIDEQGVIHAPDDPNVWQLSTVTEVIRETARAVTLRLDVPPWRGLERRAGQRVDVRLTADDGYQATRAYSISSAPGQPWVDVTVESVTDGEVSPYLVEEVRAGDQLEVRGPIGGAFTWGPDQGGPVLLAAGGSGLVPLMAMVRAHAGSGLATDVRLALSVRTTADILFAEELERLAAAGTLRRQITLTRQAAPPGWAGSTGRVDRGLLEALGPAPGAAPRIYVCGPTGFVDAAADALLALGHLPTAIRTERFGPSA